MSDSNRPTAPRRAPPPWKYWRLWRRRKSLLYALHPEYIPERGARLSYTLGLGGITVLAAILTGLTGLLLSLYYVPTPDGAHASVVLIQDVVSYGGIVRGLHYWAAQVMVLGATLHLARIVFTGGYRPPRELNWTIGLGLLVITLLWDFSGYVLRWDDGAYWALLVGTNLLREIPVLGEALYRALAGDAQVGAPALLRFYSWHMFGLTFAGGLGIVYHLWRLRKDGGISRPVPQGGAPLVMISRDELFKREMVAALFICAALVLLSTLWAVPLGPAANANGVVNDVRAPWVFLWVQNLLRDLPPFWAGIAAPLGLLLALAILPFLDLRGPGRAVWFARARWKPQVVFAALALVVIVLSLREALH